MEYPFTRHAVVSTNTDSRIGTTFEGLPIFHISYLRVYLKQIKEKFPSRNIDLVALKEKLQSFSVVFSPRNLVNDHELLSGILSGILYATSANQK